MKIVKSNPEFSNVLAKNLCIVSTLNNRVLDSYRRLYGLPKSMVDFRINGLRRLTIYENPLPLKNLITGEHFEIIKVYGCFYCYLLPFTLAMLYYRTSVEHFFSSLKPMLRRAGMYVILLRKKAFKHRPQYVKNKPDY
ncbi:MAG: hypothetical protein ACUVQ0_03125 [Thermoproteota archaeon]